MDRQRKTPQPQDALGGIFFYPRFGMPGIPLGKPKKNVVSCHPGGFLEASLHFWVCFFFIFRMQPSWFPTFKLTGEFGPEDMVWCNFLAHEAKQPSSTLAFCACFFFLPLYSWESHPPRNMALLRDYETHHDLLIRP